MRYPRPYPFHPGWLDVLSWLVPLLFFVAVVALVVWAVLRLTSRRDGPAWGAPSWRVPSRHDAALDTVRLRYARGEITREEYTSMVIDLGGQPPYAPGEPPSGAGP
jgi:putative membrane protein